MGSQTLVRRPSMTVTGATVVLCSLVTGCETYGVGVHAGGGYPEPGGVVYEEGPQYGNLGIPPGHLPPPGQCRIWYPGRPPGHQPPPQDCHTASVHVPPGAWLIEHPAHDREHVHVNVYDEDRRGNRIEVRVYNASTGVFVRAEIP